MIELKNAAHYVSDKIDVTALKTSDYITTDSMLPNRGGIVECESLPHAVRTTKYKPGDILVSNIRPYFKKIWYSDKSGGCSNDVIVFRANDDSWDSQFLYYVLSQDLFFEHMMAGANGTKMPRGNKKIIPSFLIPEYQIKLLEEAAQRLYKEWFIDLRFPGHESTPIHDGIPDGWERKTVGELIGKVHRTTQIMTSDYLDDGDIPVIDQSRDFIAGYTNDSDSLVDLGTPVIVFGDHTRILKYITFPFAKGADGTQLIISADVHMPQSLLYCSLINVDLSNYHYARHFKYLKAEEILVPALDIAQSFEKFAAPVFEQIQCLRDKCLQAAHARDRLLPKLMSGEIEV